MADVSATTRGNLVIEIDRIYPADPMFEVRLETSVLIVTLFVFYVCFVALRPSRQLWSWLDGLFT